MTADIDRPLRPLTWDNARAMRTLRRCPECDALIVAPRWQRAPHQCIRRAYYHGTSLGAAAETGKIEADTKTAPKSAGHAPRGLTHSLEQARRG